MSNLLTVKKTMNDATYTALKSLLGANYTPAKVFPIGYSQNDLSIAIEDGEDLTFAEGKLDAIDGITCIDNGGLQVDVTAGTLLTDNDTYTADPTYVKYVLVTLVVDDTTKALEMVSYEKTTGEYGAVPGGKTHAANLKEYSIGVSGTTMTEIQSWLV